jgi:flagellin
MLSIQTNVNSLTAQTNLGVNNTFQSRTIQRLTSGFRINSAGDDAAGLAVANGLRSQVVELTQGVQNGSNGLAQLQIVDGGLTNISNILDRLKTLATESASTTFTGDRGTLNNEYQSLLSEIDRQATNIKLDTNGSFKSALKVYVGGASSANSNAMVSVDLSATAVDTTGLLLKGTSVQGGGTGFANNTILLNDTQAKFDNGAADAAHNENYTISYADTNGSPQQTVVTVTAAVGGYSGASYITALNNAINTAGIKGISAQIGGDGKLQFVGAGAFTVQYANTGNLTSGPVVAGAGVVTNLTNLANYNVSGTFADFAENGAGGTVAGTVTGHQQEVARFTTGGKDYDVTLTSDATDQNHYAPTLNQAIGVINQQLVGSGIKAIKDAGGNISFQSTSSFSISETYTAGTTSDTATFAGSLFAAANGNVAVTAGSSAASATGNALSSIDSVTSALSTLGQVQGRVGAGENQLNYAISLAQSQITNFQSAESQIRDTDVAAEAANLSKAQVLQQASIAAMAQANSAPQQVLSLLRG